MPEDRASDPLSERLQLDERLNFLGRYAEPISRRVDALASEVETRSDHWYVRLIQNYISHNPDGLATFVAFNGMFAFMPITLTIAVSVALALRPFTSVEELQSNGFFADLPVAISQPVQHVMAQSSEGVFGIGIVTIIILFWGGTRFYNSLDLAFSQIYGTPRRPLIKRKLFGMIMVPLLSIIIVLTALVIPAILSLLTVPLAGVVDQIPRLSFYVSTVVVWYVLGFAMMLIGYTRIPAHAPTVRAAAPGAAVSAWLFMLLAQGFPLYVQYFGGYNLYGAVFGLVLALMLWFYLTAQIIIVGAEINAFFESRGSPESHSQVSGDRLSAID